MLGVIGFWDSYYHTCPEGTCIKKYQKFWRLTLKTFGGSHLIFVDEENMQPEMGDITIIYELYPTIFDALDAYNGANFVFMESPELVPDNINTTWLKDFVHPDEDVFYVIGNNFSGLPMLDLYSRGYLDDQNVVSIKIKYTANYGIPVPLWSHIVSAIVLSDRIQKEI